MFDGAVVASLGGCAGVITGYNGDTVPFEDRIFIGGDTFRGFALAGVGPRDINALANNGALGGTVYAVGTASARLPALLPESYGINAGLFTDFGTLGRLDDKTAPCTSDASQFSGAGIPCVKDNLAFRASAGINIG